MTLKITYVECPTSKYSIKCPYTMTPIGITVHETASDASAMNEISYMLSNNKTTSFHYAVDDTRAVQGLPLNRNGWHAGDGAKGTGNRKTIGIECCYSKSGGARYEKAFDNTLTLVAQLLKQYKWGVDKVYFHKNWSGKICPGRALANGITLDKYRKLVQERYNELYPVVESYSGYVKVIYDGLSIHNKPSWSDSTISGTVKKNEVFTIVGRIKVDGVYMYKLKSGAYITSSSKYVEYLKTLYNTTTTTTKTIKNGSRVKINKGAKYGGLSSTRGKLVPNTYIGKTYTVDSDVKTHKGVKEVRIKELNSWVAVSSLTII